MQTGSGAVNHPGRQRPRRSNLVGQDREPSALAGICRQIEMREKYPTAIGIASNNSFSAPLGRSSRLLGPQNPHRDRLRYCRNGYSKQCHLHAKVHHLLIWEIAVYQDT